MGEHILRQYTYDTRKNAKVYKTTRCSQKQFWSTPRPHHSTTSSDTHLSFKKCVEWFPSQFFIKRTDLMFDKKEHGRNHAQNYSLLSKKTVLKQALIGHDTTSLTWHRTHRSRSAAGARASWPGTAPFATRWTLWWRLAAAATFSPTSAGLLQETRKHNSTSCKVQAREHVYKYHLNAESMCLHIQCWPQKMLKWTWFPRCLQNHTCIRWRTNRAHKKIARVK